MLVFSRSSHVCAM